MSHFTTIKTKITDIDALKKALTELGYAISAEKTLVKGFNKQTALTDLAIKTGDKFGIGFVLKGTTYEIIADWWQVNRDAEIKQEDFVAKLTQAYAYHKVLSEIKRHNWTKVQEQKMEDGTIKMILTKF
jgi:hypothetical protein